MDVKIRELERLAAAGDPEARERLEKIKDRISRLNKPQCNCDIRTLLAVGCKCGGW